jgi:GntR family transcriptional regulator
MSKKPNRNLPTPLYAQIKKILFERIQNGEWQPGMCIPTEAELCQSFGVSRITVRSALSELVTEGYLERISGRGTFVTQPRINQMLRQLTSFSEDMQRRGQRPGGIVLELLTIPASADVAQKFNISEEENIILLKRLRLTNNEPMAVETAHLPARYFPGLEKENLNGQSLYQLMREKYDVTPTRAVQQITAAVCPSVEGDLLHIPKKSPVLHIYRTTFDQSERLVELVESYYRGDKYVFQAELVVES